MILDKYLEEVKCFEVTAKFLQENYDIKMGYNHSYNCSDFLVVRLFPKAEYLYYHPKALIIGFQIHTHELDYLYSPTIYKYSWKHRALGLYPMIIDEFATQREKENVKLERLKDLVEWRLRDSKNVDFTKKAIWYIKEYIMYEIKINRDLFKKVIGG